MPKMYSGKRGSHLARIIAIALCALLPAAGANADDVDDASMFSFSGFGTLGTVHSSENRADFTASYLKPKGAGYSDTWSFAVDSRIGGQVSANLTPQLSVVLQVIAEQNYDNTYSPHVEWANVKYQFTPDFSIRVGRTVLPSLILSDSRKVGYSIPWVRPPVEIYNLTPVSNCDGVDASYHMTIGAASNTLLVTAGGSDTKAPSAGTVKSRDQLVFVDTFEQGFATLHFHYSRSRLAIAAFSPLFDAFRQFGPQGAAIADKYDLRINNNDLLTTFGAGASYDPGDWFAMSEWMRFNSDSTIGKMSAWYISGGYRWGKFTPYVAYAQAKADNLSDPGLTVSALPLVAQPAAIALNAALDSALRSKSVQSTISIGGRWDFMKNTDLKLQFDHTRINAGSNGILSNRQPDFQTGGKVNLFSATIDFIF